MLPADLAHVHRDRVGEQHQHQREGGDGLERGRLEREVDQPEPGGTEQGAEDQEDADLRQPGAVDDAREQRRDQDDDADQRQCAGQVLGEHGGSMP